MLALSKYFDVEPCLLRQALIGPLATGHGPMLIDDFIIYHRGQANVPDEAKGNWAFDLIERLQPGGEYPAFRRDMIRKVFREDIYHQAVRRLAERNRSGDRATPVLAPPPVTKPRFAPRRPGSVFQAPLTVSALA